MQIVYLSVRQEVADLYPDRPDSFIANKNALKCNLVKADVNMVCRLPFICGILKPAHLYCVGCIRCNVSAVQLYFYKYVVFEAFAQLTIVYYIVSVNITDVVYRQTVFFGFTRRNADVA